jgi:hypothetical protein
MPTTTGPTNQWKLDCMQGVNQPADVYKLVLLKPTTTGTYGKASVTYTVGLAGDEVATGGGYTQGGITLTGRTATLVGDNADTDFDDVAIPTATISAAAALIVNTTRANKICGCYDFGATVSSTNDTYSVTIPSGVLRIG